MRAWVFVVAAAALAGCLSAERDAPGPGQIGGDEAALALTDPVQVNAAAQEGFEPSLRVGPDGTIYVAAARGFLAGGDASLASPVWFSEDRGATWSNLESGLVTRERLKAIEGDLAVDAKGNVYFVDTYMIDNVLTVWGPDRSWRSTRPVHGTLAVDDRPWLAAHGDGILYYVANSVVAVPSLGGPPDPMQGSRYWFYRSIDHGATWTLGHALPGADYCHLAASPVDDVTVAVVCTPAVGVRVGGADGVMGYVSVDRGATWEHTMLGQIRVPPSQTNFPAISFGADGVAYAVWLDDGTPSSLHVWKWDGAGWTEVAPPSLSVRAANPWIAAGTDGRAAVAYYGQDDEGWRLHVWKRTPDGAWLHGTDPTPVSLAPCPPEDFFQVAMDPSSRVHVAYQRDPDRGACAGVRPANQPILYLRESGDA